MQDPCRMRDLTGERDRRRRVGLRSGEAVPRQRSQVLFAGAAGFLLACAGCCCVGPEPTRNVRLALDHPNVLERGQVVRCKCSAWGSEMGRFTTSWYTGRVEVEIECPEGIEVKPARLVLELKEGEWHNLAEEEVTVTVHPRAKLGKQLIRVSGKRADGQSAIAEVREVEVTEAPKAGEPEPP